jgi:hypothetical protein
MYTDLVKPAFRIHRWYRMDRIPFSDKLRRGGLIEYSRVNENHDNDSGFKLHSFFSQNVQAFGAIDLAFVYMVIRILHFKTSRGRILHIWEDRYVLLLLAIFVICFVCLRTIVNFFLFLLFNIFPDLHMLSPDMEINQAYSGYEHFHQ